MIVITVEALVSQAAWVNYLLHYYKKDLEIFFLESKKLISFNQCGFRGGYRTTDHIYRFRKQIMPRVGWEIPVVGIPSGNYREIPSWEIL
jgi:hypothetical protein